MSRRIPPGQRCALCPKPARHEHHVARRVHDRDLVIYLCRHCHSVVNAWMYRLRMIRREPHGESCEQEREWAIAQGLIIVLLLVQPADDWPVLQPGLWSQALGAFLRASARQEGFEARFTPDPIRSDKLAGHTLPRLERVDPDWAVLVRLVGQAGARLWPEQAPLFARIEEAAAPIVTALTLLDPGACPPVLVALGDAFQRAYLELLIGDPAVGPPELFRRVAALREPMSADLLALAEAVTPNQAEEALVSLLRRYAQALELDSEAA